MSTLLEMATTDLLASVPLFSSLSRRDLSHLAKMTNEHTYEAGKVLTSTGKGGVAFFVILEGKARVELEGKKRAKILGPGDYFGEMALIDGGPRSAVVTAETDLRCQVLVQWQFRPFVKEHPEVAWSLLQGLVKRIRQAET